MGVTQVKIDFSRFLYTRRMSMNTIIEMKNIVKRYGDKLIFDHYNLNIKAGEYNVN